VLKRLQHPIVVAVYIERQEVDFSRATSVAQQVVDVLARNPGLGNHRLIEQRVLLLAKKCPRLSHELAVTIE
jgi:hypothetical protein